MKSRHISFVVLIFLFCLTLSVAWGGAPVWLQGEGAKFALSPDNGSLQAGQYGDVELLGPSYDVYWWVTPEGKTIYREQDDIVVESKVSDTRANFICKVPQLDLTIVKDYWLMDSGRALAKQVTVPTLDKAGILRVRSTLQLTENFATGAKYYTPWESWVGPENTTLFGVRKPENYKTPVVSSSGWDNRLVAGFKDNVTVGHYRLEIRGQWVPPSCFLGTYGQSFDHALRYTDSGWDFELLHTMDGEPEAVDATVVYHFCEGDFRDLWREYQQLPQVKQVMNYDSPQWVKGSAVGGFWHVNPETTPMSLQDAHALADRIGQASLPLGVFAWSITGDYESQTPFLNEGMSLIATPQWFGKQVNEFQSKSAVKMGLYIQGSLIDSDSTAFREHPEWAMQTEEGKPYFSGFRDNPLGEMYFFNVLSPYQDYVMQRIREVCNNFKPGWIYVDGGSMFETTDWRLRRPILPDQWMDFYRTLRETVHSTGEERAVLLNAQNHPYGDLYWLECGFFSATAAWRDTLGFCYDTEINHEPARTMLPLYWQHEPRYLAMCVAFGFTPCLSGIPGGGNFNETQWRAIDAAQWMKQGRLILTSGVVSPDWLTEETDVVAFTEQLQDWVVIPVLNMGAEEQVTIQIDLEKAGLHKNQTQHVRLAKPLESDVITDLGNIEPAEGRLSVNAPIKNSWSGLTLIVLGDKPLPLGVLPVK